MARREFFVFFSFLSHDTDPPGSKKAQGDGRDERGSASLKVEREPEGFSLEGECNEADPSFQKKVGGTGKDGGWGSGYPPPSQCWKPRT